MDTSMIPTARYILPSFEERTPYGSKTQDPYAKLFSDRVIFLGAAIDNVSADDIMAQLLVLESIDSDADITMYINSSQGDFTSLTAIYDTMNYIKPKVQTVCLGQASSYAAVLLMAGQKGRRMALPNARIMIHQPSVQGERGQASDIQIQAKEALRVRTWLEKTIASHTGRSIEEVSNDIDRDKYLTAEEALEYGLIDHILTSRKSD